MRKVLVAIFGACVLAFGFSAHVAQAQGTVTLCTADTVPIQCSQFGTIQAAVDATKSMKGSTNFVIKLIDGTYTENIVIGEDLTGNSYTIQGAAPQTTIIQASEAPCRTDIGAQSDKRVLKSMGPEVRLENLTIQYGCLSGNKSGLAGAGIWSSGTLSLWHVLVMTNTVEYQGTDSVPAMGGGIYSSGALDIDSSSILFNKAISDGPRAYGGGVYSVGSAHIVNSTFDENSAFSRNDYGWLVEGGAIYATRGLDAQFNTIINNEAGLIGYTGGADGGGLVGVGEPHLDGNLFFNNNGPGASPGKDYLCKPGTGLGKGTKCDVVFPDKVSMGPLRWDYIIPVYRPLSDSLTIDATSCPIDFTADQLGEARGSGRGCDLGSTESGMAYLPALVAQDQMADLSVVAINIKPQGELNSTNPVVLEVVIQNTGLAEAKRDFWVDLFINPKSEPPNQAGTVWSDLCRSAGCVNDLGISWKVTTNLLPGEQLTLTSQRMDDPYIYLPKTHWNNMLNAGDVTMWAYVDSWNGRGITWGWVSEITETNNRGGPVSRSVPVGKPQYPFSAAQFPAIESDRPANNQ